MTPRPTVQKPGRIHPLLAWCVISCVGAALGLARAGTLEIEAAAQQIDAGLEGFQVLAKSVTGLTERPATFRARYDRAGVHKVELVETEEFGRREELYYFAGGHLILHREVTVEFEPFSATRRVVGEQQEDIYLVNGAVLEWTSTRGTSRTAMEKVLKGEALRERVRKLLRVATESANEVTWNDAMLGEGAFARVAGTPAAPSDMPQIETNAGSLAEPSAVGDAAAPDPEAAMAVAEPIEVKAVAVADAELPAALEVEAGRLMFEGAPVHPAVVRWLAAARDARSHPVASVDLTRATEAARAEGEVREAQDWLSFTPAEFTSGGYFAFKRLGDLGGRFHVLVTADNPGGQDPWQEILVVSSETRRVPSAREGMNQRTLTLVERLPMIRGDAAEIGLDRVTIGGQAYVFVPAEPMTLGTVEEALTLGGRPVASVVFERLGASVESALAAVDCEAVSLQGDASGDEMREGELHGTVPSAGSVRVRWLGEPEPGLHAVGVSRWSANNQRVWGRVLLVSGEAQRLVIAERRARPYLRRLRAWDWPVDLVATVTPGMVTIGEESWPTNPEAAARMKERLAAGHVAAPTEEGEPPGTNSAALGESDGAADSEPGAGLAPKPGLLAGADEAPEPSDRPDAPGDPEEAMLREAAAPASGAGQAADTGLPNTATAGPVTLRDFQFATGNNVAELSPGQTIPAAASYSIAVPYAEGTRNQIIVGLDRIGAQACIFDGGHQGEGLARFQLTAPSEPGAYEVRFRSAQAVSPEDALGWWALDEAPTSESTVGMVMVANRREAPAPVPATNISVVVPGPAAPRSAPEAGTSAMGAAEGWLASSNAVGTELSGADLAGEWILVTVFDRDTGRIGREGEVVWRFLADGTLEVALAGSPAPESWRWRLENQRLEVEGGTDLAGLGLRGAGRVNFPEGRALVFQAEGANGLAKDFHFVRK